MSKRDIASELHRPSRKNYDRRRVNVYGKDDLWQADLVEMIPYAKNNRGYKYVLCVIDCFTKFAWAAPLKTKSGAEVSRAVGKILANRAPRLLQVDNGKEFYNKTFDAVMSQHGVRKYSTYSTTKACIVERFNRTLKTRLFREFTARGKRDWLTVLPAVMDDYNGSKHRSTGVSPAEADRNPSSVNLKRRAIAEKKVKFAVGDNVRISTYKGVFTKGYLPNWSTEIFTVTKINRTSPPTYQLIDYQGKDIAGCFYSEEIRKTRYPDDYLVEKIVRKRGDRVLVKWLGFDSAHNSWINASELKR